MIKNRDMKVQQILARIEKNIASINEVYRSGPDLYFYKRIYSVRTAAENIECFLADDRNLELIYATLVAWDMNSRGAKMKYFTEFKENISSCNAYLRKLEQLIAVGVYENREELYSLLVSIYRKLCIMKSGGELVSKSKLLHFLFPEYLMPMDGTNTLAYLYGNTGESVNKYREITDFCLEIMQKSLNWDQYLDDGWNTTIPKVIDNAIILLQGKSTH